MNGFFIIVHTLLERNKKIKKFSLIVPYGIFSVKFIFYIVYIFLENFCQALSIITYLSYLIEIIHQGDLSKYLKKIHDISRILLRIKVECSVA